MKKTRVAVALAAALSLPACQTLDDITGSSPSTPPSSQAPGRNFCSRNETLCVVGTIVVIGGLIVLLSSSTGY